MAVAVCMYVHKGNAWRNNTGSGTFWRVSSDRIHSVHVGCSAVKTRCYRTFE